MLPVLQVCHSLELSSYSVYVLFERNGVLCEGNQRAVWYKCVLAITPTGVCIQTVAIVYLTHLQSLF